MSEVVEDGLVSLKSRSVIKGSLDYSERLPKVISTHGLSYYATHSDRRLYSPAAKENMVVCGGSLWGFSLVTFLGRRTLNDRKFHNSSLSLFDPSEELIQELNDTRERPEFEGVRLPKNVFPSSDNTEAFRKANLVVIATPPGSVAQTLSSIFDNAKSLKTVILASRGFDPLSHRLPIQIAWEASVAAGRPELEIMALSGPFLPKDLIEETGGLWVLAGPAPPPGERPPEASLFRNGRFKVIVSDDPVGVQMAAALVDAYALYGAYLKSHRELKEPRQMADFVREVSGEAKKLAMALGAHPNTFDSDNPAWNSEFLLAALSWTREPILKQAAIGGRDYLAAQGLTDEGGASRLWPDRGVLGFHSIRSAYLIGKNLALSLPHLERAHELFLGQKA
jgi:glycerol-3-phosphate dehydrogenase